MPKDKWEQYAAKPTKDKWEQHAAPVVIPSPHELPPGERLQRGGEKFWKMMTTGPGHVSLTPPKGADEDIASYVWRLANTSLVPEGRAEKEGHQIASSGPTAGESLLSEKYPHFGPLSAGLKRSVAGIYADTMETLRGFLSPLALGTLGLSKAAKGIGAAGKLARLAQPVVAGGFMGQGAAQAATGIDDMADKGITPENVKESLGGTGQAILGGVGGREAITTRARVLGQEIAGAGREPVLIAEKERQARLEERQASYKESVESIAKDNASKLQEHQDKVVAAKAAYDKEVVEHQAAVAEKRQGHTEKVAAARREWVQKTYEAKRLQAEHDAAQNKLASLTRGQQAYAKVIKDNVTSTYGKVKGSLDSRWNGLRDTIGAETPLDSVHLADAINTGRQQLMGAPADLKVFNDLMRQLEGEGTVDTGDGGTPVLKPLGWQEGRTHYSALGEKMFSGELPGNVRRAIGQVRSALDGELSRVAKEKGQGKTYSALKQDWGKFEEDWRDRSSIASGGSPLARVLDAKDPGFVMSQVTGKAGERMANTLGQYSQFGGNSASISRLRSMAEQVKQVPRIRVPEAPDKLTLPAEPKLPGAPEAKSTPRLPEMKSARPIRSLPPVDPVEIRRQKLLQKAGAPLRPWEFLFVVPGMEHLLLKSPAFREWLATQPRNELQK